MNYKLTIFLLCSFLKLLAFDKQVTGLVLDSETKEPLPYANILVLGKNKGTVSNSEGNFILNLDGVSENDTIRFSYMGYATIKLRSSELQNPAKIYMHPAAVGLNEVQVLSRSLSAEEIIKLVKTNFETNHSENLVKKQLFYHRYEKVPFKKENHLIVKKSDVSGINNKTINEIFKKIPTEFVGYQDAILDLYQNGNEFKLLPVKAISLEENSQQDLMNEIEAKLGTLIKDIEKSNADPDIYYKVRTGILSHKIKYNQQEQPSWDDYKNDTLNYTVQNEFVKNEILYLYNDFADIDGKNWDFVSHTSKYNYTLHDLSILNDEVIYQLSFKPKAAGLFEGTIYVSTSSYAVLQVDFAYAKGKRSENIHLLGFGHSMNFKEGRVIFEKGKKGYHVKYIYAKQNESISIDRDFSIVKKQKRFFIDKELNEIKLDARLSMDLENYWELLLLESEDITQKEFSEARQPNTIKFKKDFKYRSELWDNTSILAPSSELSKYQRK